MNSSLRVEPNTLGLIWIRAPGRSALGGKHRIRRAGQPYSARLLNPPNERRAAAQQGGASFTYPAAFKEAPTLAVRRLPIGGLWAAQTCRIRVHHHHVPRDKRR